MDNFLDSLKKTEGESTPTFYEILGCGQNANTDQIITEFRAKALAFHPDKNSNKTECENKFKEICTAKEILMDPAKRAKYDQWLNSGVLIPWKEWSNLTEKSQTIFHWKIVKNDPMIESARTHNAEKMNNLENFRDSIQEKNDILNKFRNYQI